MCNWSRGELVAPYRAERGDAGIMKSVDIVSIVQLQVQVERLKRGEKPHRWYDTSRVRPVDRLYVGEDGCVGETNGEKIVDVHNVIHPHSRNHGRASGLSLGFTSHYRAMRERFGPHVINGAAGENVLVDVEERLTRDRLAHAAIRTRSGVEVRFAQVEVAEPCVEFSRFVMRVEPGDRTLRMREPLQQLRGGMRGFYVALAQSVELQVGDELLIP
ncbi:MAG: MOSC domain-containing protein [Vicinamibacteraceae bacterium]